MKPLTRARRSSAKVIEPWTHRATYHHFEVAGCPKFVERAMSQMSKWDTYRYDGLVEIAADPEQPRVGVFGEGELIGWLAIGDSEPYIEPLRALSSAFRIFIPCAGWWNQGYEFDDGSRYESRGSFTVQLPPPGGLVVLNDPPACTHIMLPPGGSVKTSGGDKYSDHLRQYVTASGEGYVYATLHAITLQRTRSTVDLVEVRIDGHPAGILTERMSEHLRGMVDEFAKSGITLACRASVLGSSISARVTIYPARPHELSNAWITEQLDDLTRRSGLPPLPR